jgi:hypothetical protein
MKKGKKVEDFLIGSGAWPRDYSTTVYLDRHAYWRLAHFQQGCGAAVPRRAISVCHSCLAFLQPKPSAMKACRCIRPTGCHQIGFLSVN